MTQSPKKYVSNFTSSTTNRGVEAKEIEIANAHLDNVSASTQYQESCGDLDVRSQASGETGSYLQVVVQKHKRRDPATAATQTYPRLPDASSPIKAARDGSGDTQLYVWQQPMLFAYQKQNSESRSEIKRDLAPVKEEVMKQTFWTKLQELTNENSPDRLEMYYFERCNGDFLTTSDGTFTYSEQVALRASRIANRFIAEFFAIPQIVANIPVSIFLHVERSVLRALRSLTVGSVQIMSDYLLKPGLTLLFNAMVQPPLVFFGNVVRAVREAVRPIAHLIGDFVEPLVKVLNALRLVSVEKCGCAQAV